MAAPRRIPKSCQQRHHSYDSDAPDALCIACGKRRGTREPRALGAGGVSGLRAALGIPEGQGIEPARPAPEKAPEPGPERLASPPGPAAASPPAPAELEPPRRKPSSVIWPRVAHRGTQVFEGIIAWANERRGCRANEPEPEDRADFEAALGEELAIWFPDVAAGPFTRMLMAGTFMAVEMSWNAERIAPPPEKQPPPAVQPPTPAAETTNGSGAAPVAATEVEARLLQDLQSSSHRPV